MKISQIPIFESVIGRRQFIADVFDHFETISVFETVQNPVFNYMLGRSRGGQNQTAPWVTEWQNILFSGESNFCLHSSNQRSLIYRRIRERYLERYIAQRRTGVMVWGAVFVLPWPSMSPDRDPIEHLWDLVKRKLQALSPQPWTKEELILKKNLVEYYSICHSKTD